MLEQSTSSQAELEAEVVTWQVIDIREGVKNLVIACFLVENLKAGDELRP